MVIGDDTVVLIKVYCSNFDIVGFIREVSGEELVVLVYFYGVLVLEDLGSGCLVDLSVYGLLVLMVVQ